MGRPLSNTYMAKPQDLSGVAASGSSTCAIETTRNVHAIHLDCRSSAGVALTEAQMKNDIDKVEVRLNGILLVDVTATQLIDWLSYYLDRTAALTLAGQLVIPFTRMNLPVAGLNRLYALGMISPDGKPNNLTLKVTYTSGLTTLSAVHVHYEYDLFDPEELGLHVRLLSHTRTFSGTGYLDITDLPKLGRQAVFAYHFVDGTGVMASMTVKHNNFDVFEETPLDLLNWRGHRGGRIPQTGYMHIDFATLNDFANGLPLGDKCNNLLLRPYYSTSPGGSFTIIEECACNGLQ